MSEPRQDRQLPAVSRGWGAEFFQNMFFEAAAHWRLWISVGALFFFFVLSCFSRVQMFATQ